MMLNLKELFKKLFTHEETTEILNTIEENVINNEINETTPPIVNYNWSNLEKILIYGLTQNEFKTLVEKCHNSIDFVHQDKANRRKLANIFLQYIKNNSSTNDLLLELKRISSEKYKRYGPFILQEDNQADVPNGKNEVHKRTRQNLKRNHSFETHHIPDKFEPSPQTKKEERNDNIPHIAIDDSGEKKYKQKILRREIRETYQQFVNEKRFESAKIIDFFLKHKDNLNVLSQVLTEFKGNAPLPRYIAEQFIKSNISLIEKETIFTQISAWRTNWLKEILPDPIIITLPTDENGPNYQLISPDYILSKVYNLMGQASPDLIITGSLYYIKKAGTYPITIKFSADTNIIWNIRIDIYQDEIPPKCEDIKLFPVIEIEEETNVIEQLMDLVSDVSKFTYAERQYNVGRILNTAYSLGFWKNSWIQILLQEWLNEKHRIGELRLITNRKELPGILKNIIKFDNDNLDEGLPSSSENAKQFQAFKQKIHEDVSREIIDLTIGEITLDFNELIPQILEMSYLDDYDKSEAHILNEVEKKLVLYIQSYALKEFDYSKYALFCLVNLCYFRGGRLMQQGKKKEARAYLLLNIYLVTLLSDTQTKDVLQRRLIKSVVLYFASYEINLNRSVITPVDLYKEFLYTLPTITSNLGNFGHCLLELAIANNEFLSNLISHISNLDRERYKLNILVDSLQDVHIARLDPIRSLRIIIKIRIGSLGKVILNFQNEKNIWDSDKRLFVASLVKLMCVSKSSRISYDTYFNEYKHYANEEERVELAYLILFDSYITKTVDGEDNQENAIKADAISIILGLQEGSTSTEYLVRRLSSLSLKINEYARIKDGPVQSERIAEIDEISKDIRPGFIVMGGTDNNLISLFFEKLMLRISIEQAKQTRDTECEVKLMSTKAAINKTKGTRLIFEIKNCGDGPAENIELLISPFENKYTVDDRYQKIKIGRLIPKSFIQIETFIIPEIGENNTISLMVNLQYKTLTQRKSTTLASNNMTVRLYTQSEFSTIPIAFNYSTPATDLFYGRQVKLQNMISRLKFNNGLHDDPILVYGIKRAGKTSLVKKFYEQTINERSKVLGLDGFYLPIYCDIMTSLNDDEKTHDNLFLQSLIRIIISGLPVELRSNFNLVDYTEDFKNEPKTIFLLLLEQILKSIYPKRILIILDEFSKVGEALENPINDNSLSIDLFHFLSNIIQHNSQINFIFTGTYMLYDLMRTYAKELWKICYPQSVGSLEDDEDASRLITEPARNTKTRQSEGGCLNFTDRRVVQKIIHVTNRHPYLIQYLGCQLIDYMNRNHTDVVNLYDCDEVLKDLVANQTHPALRLMWDEFEGRPHQKLLQILAKSSDDKKTDIDLSEISASYKEIGINMSIEQILELCQSLEDADLIRSSSSEKGTKSFYLSMPLFRMWLKQNKSY